MTWRRSKYLLDYFLYISLLADKILVLSPIFVFMFISFPFLVSCAKDKKLKVLGNVKEEFQ